jgi:hypothetical protein
VGRVVFLHLKLTHETKTQTRMHILNLFEAVYKSHVLSLVKKGLECSTLMNILERCLILKVDGNEK